MATKRSRVFVDAKGIGFLDGRLVDAHGSRPLPEPCADWPGVKVIRAPTVCSVWLQAVQTCLLCEAAEAIHAYHIIGGSRGSDEDCNILPLCWRCHYQNRSLTGVLWIKWKWFVRSTDWVRLAILLRHHLPTPRSVGVTGEREVRYTYPLPSGSKESS